MEASPDVLWKEKERERWKDIKMGKEKKKGEREGGECEREGCEGNRVPK